MRELTAKLLGMPPLASQNGQDVDNLIIYVHWLMLALFLGWIIYFFYAVNRFRRSRNPKADYVGVTGHASHYAELAVVVAEAVLLLFIAVPLWAKAVDKFPDPKNATVIQVVAQQFAWNARYADTNGYFGRQDMKFVTADNMFGLDPTDASAKDHVQVLNEIHVPVGKPVIIYVSSKDVIHSLKIIAMRVCQDAIPGLRIPCWFVPTQVGRYQINCAQLCGNGHAAMTGGFLIVQTQADFDKWLKSKSSSATSNASFE
jgi:cytochrome c oxidase subunit 2